MAKFMDVGTSWRTAMKHAAATAFITREFRAGNHLHWITRFCLIDLTAGNGEPAYDAPWHSACSPGIIAKLALTSRKPVVIDLYERDQATYETLLGNLAKQLPALGYQRTDINRWECKGKVWLRVLPQDGRTASIDHLGRTASFDRLTQAYKTTPTNDAVLVLNDPNLITDWAMRPGFMAEALNRDPRARASGKVTGLRVMHTLGCNVGGAKRTPFQRETAPAPTGDHRFMNLSERRYWFNLIEEQCEDLPARHDLALAAFKNDPAQWAYLFTTPRIDRWYADTEADIRSAFNAVNRTGEIAFYRRDRERFEQLKMQLLLTKNERAEQENPALPFACERELCDKPLPPSKGATPRKYCSQSCRQRAYEARRTHKAIVAAVAVAR